MKTNNTLKEIGEKLSQANNVLIFPHIVMDGDALGSAIALCEALRNLGKNSYILIEDGIPRYLQFLDDGHCVSNESCILEPDVCVCVDCADEQRIARRITKFVQGKTTICIDHHKTSENFADYNHIDEKAAATGELIYKLLHSMGVNISKKIGEAIYTAIVSDTGNFQYASTHAQTHEIAVELFHKGIDHDYISRMLYQNMRVEKLYLSGQILQTLKIIGDGQIAMAYVTQKMLAQTGALMEDAEGSSEMLRGIGGIEISVFAKEAGICETKFSMRAKTWADVSAIAVKYGGGGHTKASGCTIRMPICEAMKVMEAELEAYIKKAKANND